jgi:hypothetical protein
VLVFFYLKCTHEQLGRDWESDRGVGASDASPTIMHIASLTLQNSDNASNADERSNNLLNATGDYIDFEHFHSAVFQVQLPATKQQPNKQ